MGAGCGCWLWVLVVGVWVRVMYFPWTVGLFSGVLRCLCLIKGSSVQCNRQKQDRYVPVYKPCGTKMFHSFSTGDRFSSEFHNGSSGDKP